jgi:hypothetical protein
MILGGGQCQKCKCIPCDPCEQECTEPHTGDAFEVVYTHYNLGVQAGNLSDGYLTASGDNDTSDPLDGMDGNGPWYQQIEGGFSFGPSVTRHPCTIRVSFWRNNFTLGPTVFPPPAATLTLEEVTVTCGSGKIFVGETVLEEGQTYTYTGSIPLVAGGGDKSEDDPRTFGGTLAIQPVCREASFEVKARIEWNTKQRQHVLYGIVRECYDEPGFCDDTCGGTPAPDVVYVTISNYTGPSKDSPYAVNGTYVMERIPGTCDAYWGDMLGDAPCFGDPLRDNAMRLFIGDSGAYVFSWKPTSPFDGVCGILGLVFDATVDTLCGSGVVDSGANGQVSFTPFFDGTLELVEDASFDWEIEV